LAALWATACSSVVNPKREELKAPERKPLWVHEGSVDRVATAVNWGAIREGSYLDLRTGAPVDAAQVQWPPGVRYMQPKKSALPFDEPSVERVGLFGSRVLAMGSKKPEDGRTSYGMVASDRESAKIVWTHFAAAPLCKLSYPLVLDDKVFFIEEAAYAGGNEMHTILALDLATGKKVWSKPHKGGTAQFFGYIEDVADGKVWVRNYGRKGAAYRVLDAATGADVAEMSTATEYKSVVIRGGVLYGIDRWGHSLMNEAGMTTPDSYVVAVDAMTGAPLWKSEKQELCELRRLTVTAEGVVLVARYPVTGAKVKEAVMAFAGGR
jgi:hypothetical protein